MAAHNNDKRGKYARSVGMSYATGAAITERHITREHHAPNPVSVQVHIGTGAERVTLELTAFGDGAWTLTQSTYHEPRAAFLAEGASR